MRSLVLGLLGCLLTTLLVATPTGSTAATSDPRWTPPETLGAPGTGARMAVNHAGDAVAVWSTGEVVKASYRPHGANWQHPAELGAGDSGDLHAFIDDRGRATAVWFQGYGARVVDRLADGSWKTDEGAGRAMRTGGMWPGALRAAMDSDGRLVLTQTDADDLWGEEQMLAWRTRGGRWTDTIEAGGSATDMAVHDGVAQIVKGGGGVYAQGARIGHDATRWHRVWPGAEVFAVDLAANARGDLALAVLDGGEPGSGSTPDDAGRLVVLSRPAGGTWREAFVDDAPVAARRPAVAVGPAGEIGVVYERAEDGALMARLGNVHQRTATPATALASAVSDQGPATIDFAGSGDVVVAWAARGSGTPVPVLASHRRPDGSWKEPEQIGTHDAPWTVPEVNGYPNGMFTALFEHARTVRWTDLVDDRIGPTTILQSPRRGYQRSHRIVVRWSATDEQSRPRDIDVQWRRSGRDNRLGPWHAFRDRTTRNAVRLRGADGHTYCFRARSRDRVGNVGPWSRRRCTSTPVDDRSMRGAGWHRVHDGAAYGNTLTRASRGAGSLKLGEVRARTLRLVARTCPRCGQVQVSQGRRDLGVFSLRSRRVRDKRVIVVANYRRMHEGRVVIRAVTPHERVSIDGLVASR